ncbi:MAG: hypothetical protein NC124_14380 [Clostridium sp.]|nr:hypothetical protein [Clostridium sp.]
MGRISEEKRQYKCYYPFLEYSPELVALKCAKMAGIEAAYAGIVERIRQWMN